MLLPKYLNWAVRRGALECIAPDGTQHSFGDGTAGAFAERPVRMVITDKSFWRSVTGKPHFAFAESYIAGGITFEQGDLKDFLRLVVGNLADRDSLPKEKLTLLRSLWLKNSLRKARKNSSFHYDQDEALFRLFLDSDMQYTCGYWADGVQNIEEAQVAKRRHIIRKLRLSESGLKVLDIGSGWGGLSLEMARDHGAQVKGILLSEEQKRVAEQRVAEAGLAENCHFALQDYRHHKGQYDRIVTVGMLEHIGKAHYPTYFRKVQELLAPDGVYVLHTIVSLNPHMSAGDPFILKYIFPGGAIPTLSILTSSIAKAGLHIRDSEIWHGTHYEKTLLAWNEKFQANRAEAEKIRDSRFCRVWELYLLGFAAMFRYGPIGVVQIQVTHPRGSSALPLTRDYLYA